MYELIQVSQDCYYIQSPAKIGLIRTAVTGSAVSGNGASGNGASGNGVSGNGVSQNRVSENGAIKNGVFLIDSGNDKDAGKKIRRILENQGWSLQAIFNTHSHADHIGGNAYLQSQTSCRIYAPGIECDFTRHPVLEPSFLYGGNPPKELRHKFMMAQPSDAFPLTPEVLPEGVSMIKLPGHSFDMVGFRTKDDVVYLADCLSSRETLEKYQIGFIVDVGAYLETLENVKRMEAKLFIPSHADPTEDIAPLAQLNIDKVNEIADEIVRLCSEPIGFEALLMKLFECYQLKMTFEQHALVGSTVRSYLTWLNNTGRVEMFIDHNQIMWKS